MEERGDTFGGEDEMVEEEGAVAVAVVTRSAGR